jgi:hypothetical protein
LQQELQGKQARIQSANQGSITPAAAALVRGGSQWGESIGGAADEQHAVAIMDDFEKSTVHL